MAGLHPIGGFVLYFGVLLIAWWLIAAASGPNAYANIEWFMGSWIGRLVLPGYTWALLHHMLGGVRHLIWDLGYGFEPAEREFLALATIVGSISLTLVVWVVGYLALGGPRWSRVKFSRPCAACAGSAPPTPARATSGISA